MSQNQTNPQQATPNQTIPDHILREILTFRPEIADYVEPKKTLSFHNDGNENEITPETAKAPPMQMYLVGSDQPDGDPECVFDPSNVEDDDFDITTAIAGNSPRWKFVSLDVSNDGIITPFFLGRTADNANHIEIVTVSNAAKHFEAIFEYENGRRHCYISQQYVADSGSYLTTVIVLLDGRKTHRFFSDGADMRRYLDYGTDSAAAWHVTVYQTDDPATPGNSPA